MEYFGLTNPQKNIYELQCFYKNTTITNLCGAVIFNEIFDTAELTRSLEITVGRCEALRLRFCTVEGKRVQYVSEEPPQPFEYVDFVSETDLRSYCSKQARTPFRSDDSQMYRITVFTLGSSSGIMLCASHLIADAWTYSILAKEVYETYKKLRENVSVNTAAYSYTDSIAACEDYRRSSKYNADKLYWSDKYTQLCSTNNVFERSIIKHYQDTKITPKAQRLTASLGRSLSSQMDSFCKQNSISTAAFIEAVMLIYLKKIDQSSSCVTIGVPVLGRSTFAQKKTAGMFVQTLPLTLDITGSDTLLDVCTKTFKAHKQLYRHSRLPYSEIFAQIHKVTGFTGRLFDVYVSAQNAKTDIPAKTLWFSNGCSEVPLAIHIDDRDSSDSYTLTLDYQSDIFPESREIHLVFDRIRHTIDTIIKDPDKAINDLSIIAQNEYDLLNTEFNDTKRAFPENIGVHEAFSKRASEGPDKIALVFCNEVYTYKRLDRMSNALAAALAEKGIGRGDIVPIISVRSPYFIVAMLAVLKTGAAYMPLSPSVPKERAQFMLNKVLPKLILTCGCSQYFDSQLELDKFDYSRTNDFNASLNGPDDLCYVIFTSGSTGQPKGVAVTHKNVMNYCSKNDLNVCGNIITDDIKTIISVTDFVFDIYVTESLLALINGLKIVLADDEQALSQAAVSKLVRDNNVTLLQTTPTKMRSLLFDKNNCSYLANLKAIMLGGEELPRSLYDELRALTNAKIYNVYGPAETTVWSTVSMVENGDITVGRPIANTCIYILDERLAPVPIGAVGEICISGDGVAAGYYNDPTLTDTRFVNDAFNGNMYSKMYRTGDLGLFRCDGTIEFIGRADTQIKLRGLRIELGEIENVMMKYEGVSLSAAVCRADSRGEQRIVGFYTGCIQVGETTLRSYLTGLLPAYMVPSRLVRLDKMPMTPSGKIDRKALPQVDFSDMKNNICPYAAPQTNEQKLLCRIFAKVLKLEQIGIDDDFFTLGGDSFNAIELCSLAQAEGLSVSVHTLYEKRTVREICTRFEVANCTNPYTDKLKHYPNRRSFEEKILFKLFVLLSNLLYRFDVEGLDELDPFEKYIICPNHESDLDCMWVWAALSRRFDINKACALIAAEHLQKPLSRLVFRLEGGIPIDRKGDFMPSLKRASALMKRDMRLLLIHPEGTRTRSGRLGQFKRGAELLSKRTGIKLVPVFIEGAREIYPVTNKLPRLFDLNKFRRYRLKVTFGQPLEKPDTALLEAEIKALARK